MKKEDAIKAVEFINNVCKSEVERILKSRLGVEVEINYSVEDNRYCGPMVKAEISNPDVSSQMIVTPILRQLFKSATLEVRVYPCAEEGVMFQIAVQYAHNYDGGSNGHSLMAIAIDESGNVIERM